jgi:serine beta-lactamase-like protein LACTB
VSTSWKRTETWLTRLFMAVCLVIAGVMGLWVYMSATARPLHPNPQDVPSATGAAPLQRWGNAVEQGRQIVRTALVEQNLPGLSVAVGAGEDIVWAEGFGWADLEQRVPVKPETRFRIGTASTALTSAAVGLLIEKGRLDLDEEIQTYVPELPGKEWPITLRHVMGHVGGLWSDGGDESPLFSEHCEQAADGLRFFADRPLLFEPGSEYRYSNYGWIAVSAAVETAANQPFLTFMREQIFEPLGMDATSTESATEEIPNRATLYFPRFAADPRYGLHLMRPLDLSCYAGSMAFLSTASDLVRFGLGMNRGTLLQPATVQLLQTPQRLTTGQETGYGLGWDLATVTLAGRQTQAAVRDGNSLGGRVVSLMTFRERGIAVAVVSNISYADTSTVALKIAEAFAAAEPR